MKKAICILLAALLCLAGYAETVDSTDETEDRLDDITYIGEMQHFSINGWQQYDILLAAQGYGWETMLGWADYMAEADLDNISQVTVSSIGADETDITESYHNHNDCCKETPELEPENSVLSIAGISRTLMAPMKIVWFNQTRVLRFFTLVDDDLLIRKYVETVIRRTFGTDDAMKLAKDLPEG